jgi:ribonuclease E
VAAGDLPLEPPTPVVPAYRGPTPADPYAGQIDALFAAFDPDAELEPAPVTVPAPVSRAPEPAEPVADAPVEAPPVLEPAVLEPDVASADVVTAEVVPVVLAEPEAPVAEEAKPKRAPRPRKAKVAASAEPVEATVEVTPAEVPAAEGLPEAAPKPARRRASSRAKAAPADVAVVQAEAEAEAEAEPAVEAAAPVIVEEVSVPPVPVIKPIVVGVDTPAVAKRQGWWKR